MLSLLFDRPAAHCGAMQYLISDSSSIVIDCEDWQWVLGLGIVRAVPMVIVALLEEGMVGGLMRKHSKLPTHIQTLYNVLHVLTQSKM